ncbi:MAG: hypothetical protein WBM24_19895, partial [Candidatus Sulfotelmatobacter sp.]
YTESTFPVHWLGISIRAICDTFVGSARQLLDDGALFHYPVPTVRKSSGRVPDPPAAPDKRYAVR